MGGKPNPGTKKDKRLKGNQPSVAKKPKKGGFKLYTKKK